MSGKVKFRHRLEYAAVRTLEALFRALPFRCGVVVAIVLAKIAFNVVGFRKKEAIRRILQVFPGKSRREARRIAYVSLRNIFLNATEIMGISGVSDKWLDKHYVSWRPTMDLIRRHIADGHGVIMALPHMGNWDLAGITVAHCGMPIFSVSGVQHNPLTNDWLNRKRATGINMYERGSSALRHIVTNLKRNQVFAILPDVRMKTPDLEIDFLGSKANLGRGMAAFARKTNSPIVVTKIKRVGVLRHSLGLHEPIFPDPSLSDDEDVKRMTQLAMDYIEKDIREAPEQWFWYNKRWVLEPLD